MSADLRSTDTLLPLCQPDLPFSFRPSAPERPSPLLGTVLLPLTPADLPASEPFPLYPADGAAYLRSRDEILAAPMAFPDLRALVATWFTAPVGNQMVPCDGSMLTRLLTVLAEVAVPGRHPGAAAHDYTRSVSGFCPAPGGNLTTLLWLGWRYSVQLALRLHALPNLLAGHDSLDAFRAALQDAVQGVGLIPAHDFAKPVPHDAPAPPYWPGASAYRAANHAVHTVGRAVRCGRACDIKTGRSRSYFLRTLPQGRSRLSERERASVQAANLAVYRTACADILSGVVEALRVVGFAALRLQHLATPEDPSLGPLPVAFVPTKPTVNAHLKVCARLVECLAPLAKAEPSTLDRHFIPSARETGVPFSWFALAEADLARRFREWAWVGTALAWGVLPGDPDSPRYAGRYRPRNAPVLDPTRVHGIPEIGFTPPPGYDAKAFLTLLAGPPESFGSAPSGAAFGLSSV